MIVVNLYGGPGAGKSTGAAYVFSRLKEAGVAAELVTEFAKDLTWDHSRAILDQMFVFGTQYHWLARLELDGVQAAVTDSPLLLSVVYAKNDVRMKHRLSTHDRQVVAESMKRLNASFDNRDFVIRRAKPYVGAGRNETESEAKEIDRMIDELGLEPIRVDGMTTGYETIVQHVLREIKSRTENERT